MKKYNCSFNRGGIVVVYSMEGYTTIYQERLKKEVKKILDLKFDENGLIPAIIQDAGNNQVLMLAYMTMESLKLTLKSIMNPYTGQ